MEGPILGIRFVHTAIRRETADIDETVASVSTPEQATALGKRIDFLALMVHLHTDGEEVAMFPKLEEKAPNFAAHYLYDHKEEESLIHEIQDLVKAVAQNPADRTAKVRSDLQRRAAALRHHANLHVGKEESIVIPTIVKLFSPPEQGAIVQQVLSRYTPDQVREMLPWIINWLEPADRAIYMRDMSMGMPPPVFAAAKDWIRSGTSAEVWADLQKRVPDLLPAT